MFPSSLRARPTVWHGLVLAVMLIGFTVAVYGLLGSSLSLELDQSLADRARQVNSAIPSVRPGPPGPPNRPSPPPRIIIPRPDSFASADTFVPVAAVDGEVSGWGRKPPWRIFLKMGRWPSPRGSLWPAEAGDEPPRYACALIFIGCGAAAKRHGRF